MAKLSVKYPPGLWMAALAGSSGLFLVLVFPKFSLFPLSAMALVPLLWVTAREASPVRRFLWGLFGGSVFFSGACYWIPEVLRAYGGLNPLSAAGVFVLFVLVLALYWALFAWLAGYCWQRAWAPLAIPLLWVSLEYARAHLFSGFPWLLVGYALTDYYALARVAQWSGVYGLSYLLVALNLAWVWLFARRGWAARAHLVVVLGCFLYLGLTPPNEAYREEKKAYLVQTNIPQDVAFERWDAAAQAPLLERLERLTLDSVGRQGTPALVLWPEMPAPFYFWDDSFTRSYAQRIARRTNSFFLLGIIAFTPESNRTQPLNSEVLLDPEGRLISQYDKIHLVPFGEYVPLKQWLGFAGKLTAQAGDFVPGSRFVVSELPGGGVSGLICYEAIFPHLVRQFVREGAGLLVNISNDGWFGSSAARHQHLLMARMRAIENRRYLLRTTNTGITAVIRPSGRIAAQLPPDQAGVLAGRFAFQTAQTFYTKYGDWFPLVACSVSGLLLFGIRVRRRPAARSVPKGVRKRKKRLSAHVSAGGHPGDKCNEGAGTLRPERAAPSAPLGGKPESGEEVVLLKWPPVVALASFLAAGVLGLILPESFEALRMPDRLAAFGLLALLVWAWLVKGYGRWKGRGPAWVGWVGLAGISLMLGPGFLWVIVAAEPARPSTPSWLNWLTLLGYLPVLVWACYRIKWWYGAGKREWTESRKESEEM